MVATVSLDALLATLSDVQQASALVQMVNGPPDGPLVDALARLHDCQDRLRPIISAKFALEYPRYPDRAGKGKGGTCGTGDDSKGNLGKGKGGTCGKGDDGKGNGGTCGKGDDGKGKGGTCRQTCGKPYAGMNRTFYQR